MFRKAYILTFDKGGFSDNFDYNKFHDQLISTNGVFTWWHYLESTYIIIVDHTITAKNVTDYIMSIMPKKKFFTCELNLSNHNGYLDSKAWEWINDQIKMM